MRRYPYRTLDVFAERPLEGNPLAVIPEAQGISDLEMQAVAREFNLSETTFVLRRDEALEAERGIRTRIFTVDRELPFAGHPTLGTATALRGDATVDQVALELDVGRVPVRFRAGAGPTYAEMTQPTPVFGRIHAIDAVAAALGVPAAALDPGAPPQTVSTGNAFGIVAFRQLATLQSWRPSWPRLAAWLAGTDASFVYAVSAETVDPACQLHARMPFIGGEDPATGSAVGPAVAWMVQNGRATSDELITVEQGLEVHRPSRLYAQARRTAGEIEDVRVGGFVHSISEGTLTIP